MDFKRVKDSFETLQGLVAAGMAVVGSLALAWATLTEALDPFLVATLGLPPRAAHAGTIGVAVALIVVVFWRNYRRLELSSRVERPDVFTLRPTTPDTLIGREDDLRGLLAAVRQKRLVLLDGESGCGKTALVTAGLVPRLRESDGLLPIVLRDWGEDWECGPLAAALGALHESVSAAERERLGWQAAPDLATDASALAAELDARLEAVTAALGRRPLLIADQFDDYLSLHRLRFLDPDGGWSAPSAVAAANRFWGLVSEGLHASRLHALIVSRADTAAGTLCVRFVGAEQSATRSLPRVAVDYLRPLLAGIAPDGAVPAIVSHPAGGWHDLRELLERDLRAGGAILMQQVRTVLLGLRQLPALTPARYRRAGGLHGMEALVIERALRRAAAADGGEDGVRRARAVLAALVLPGGRNQPPKAHRASLAELGAIAGSLEAAEGVLRVLQSEEVVRPADAGTGVHAWQLDHDYLARAVLAEARQADRWAVELREGKARYDHAAGARAAWRALLPAGTLIRVCWERVRGRLAFGEASGYARLSALRPAVATLLALLAGVGAYRWTLDRRLTQQALRIVDRLGGPSASEAVLAVWRAPEPLRVRVYEQVRADSSRLERAVRDGWACAHAGFEPVHVREAAALLRERLDRDSSGDDRDGWSRPGPRSLTQYSTIVSRMISVPDIKAEAAVLRTRLIENTEQTNLSRWQLGQVLGFVLARLEDPADLKAEVDLVRTLIEHESDARKRGGLVVAYDASLARVRDVDVLKAEAKWLRRRVETERDASIAEDLAATYAASTARVGDAAGLREVAALLRARTVPASPLIFGFNSRYAYGPPYSEVIARMDDASVLAEAQALRDRLSREHDPTTSRRLENAYATVSSRLHDVPELRLAARALRARIAQEEASVYSVAEAYATVALRLGDAAELRAGAAALRARWATVRAPYRGAFLAHYASIAAALADAHEVRAAAKAERAFLVGMTISGAPFAPNPDMAKPYGAIASWLDEADIPVEANELRVQLAATPDYGPLSKQMLVAAYMTVAARLNEADAKVEARAWFARMEEPGVEFVEFVPGGSPSPFVQAYVASVARLSRAGVRAEVAVLRARLENERDSRITERLADAYAALAPTLGDAQIAMADAGAFRSRIEREVPQRRTAGLETAYAAAVLQLDEPQARNAAALIRRLIEKERTGWAESRLVAAYALVAARLKDPDDAKAAAATLRPLLEPKQPFNAEDFNRRAQAYASVAAHLRPADLMAEAQALRARVERTLPTSEYQRGPTALVKAYGAVATLMVEQAADKERSRLVREILTLAGQPFLENATPLLAALKPAAGRDFGDHIGAAVRWAEQAYGIKPEELRPTPLAN